MSDNTSPEEWGSLSPNLSILTKVKSRLSQWFSPLSSDEATGNEDNNNGGINGGLQRKRSPGQFNASPLNDSDTNVEDQPPLKRSKTALNNEFSSIDDHQQQRFRSASFMATSRKMTSTPTTSNVLKRAHSLANRRRLMGIEPSGLNNSKASNRADLNEKRIDDEEKLESNPNITVELEEDDEEEEDVERREQEDVVAELNSNNVSTVGKEERRRFTNGSDSGSEESFNSSSKMSDRRKLTGLNRLRSARNGSSQSINFSSHLQTEKSLFSDKNVVSASLNNSTNSLNSLLPKRSFNPSLYGSISALSDSRLFNMKSPYYNGPTMFGGASAYSQKPILRSNASKLFKSNTGLASIRNSASLSALPTTSSGSLREEIRNPGPPGSSSTAKRILDLLNQHNSPLSDVRKMATGNLMADKRPGLVSQKSRFTEQDLNRSVRLNTPKTPYSRTMSNQTRHDPITTELQVPSMSQLLQMSKLQRSTEEIRKLAFSSKSFLNEQIEYKLPDVSTSKTEKDSNSHVNKMKNKISKPNKPEKELRDEPLEVPKLPEIKFPEMKSMPVIDFQIQPNNIFNQIKNVDKVVVEKVAPISENKISSEKTVSLNKFSITKDSNETVFQPLKTNGSPSFEFAAPIMFDTATKQLSPIKVDFKFSEPAREVAPKPTTSTLNSFKFNPATAKTTTIVEKSSSGRIDSGFTSAASTLKSGSCEEALGLIPKQNTPLPVLSSFGDKFKPASNTWECPMCFIRNKEADLKCLACESPRVTETAKKPSVTEPSKPLDEGFKALIQKQTAAKWECSSCMLKNEDSANKCACCEAPKPGAKQEPAKTNSNTMTNPFAPSTNVKFTFGATAPIKAAEVETKQKDDGFSKIVSQQNAKWECSTCMTRNEASSSKCACCEQAKPGAASENLPQFSFGAVPSNSASKFSFGVPKQDKITSSTSSSSPFGKAPEPKSEAQPQFKFGASNSSLVKPATTATFSFGVPDTKATPKEVKVPEVKEPEKEAPKFSFGASIKPADPLTNSSSKPAEAATGGFKFNVSSTTEKKPEESKTLPKEGFSFPLGGTGTASGSTSGFQFGASTAVPKPEVKASTTPAAPVFGSKLFGSPDVPKFGAASSTTTETPKLGTTTSTAPTQSPAFGSSIVFGQKAAPTETKEEPKKFEFSASKTPFTFGGSTSSTPAAGEAKTEVPAPVLTFGAASAAAPSKTTAFTFGSSASSTTEPAKPASSQFTFGSASAAPSPKAPENKIPTLGSSTFSGFGGVSSSPSSNIFGAKPAESISSPFGAASPSSAPSISSPFGSGANNNSSTTSSAFGAVAAQPIVPSFGSSGFGAAATPQQPAETKSIFGAAAATTPAVNPFGATASSPGSGAIFGSLAPPQNKVPMFGTPSVSSFDVNDGQKAPTPFAFQAPANPPQQEASSSLFTFGASSNNSSSGMGVSAPMGQQEKPAYNFNASVTPNFNFSAAPSPSNCWTAAGQQSAAEEKDQGGASESPLKRGSDGRRRIMDFKRPIDRRRFVKINNNNNYGSTTTTMMMMTAARNSESHYRNDNLNFIQTTDCDEDEERRQMTTIGQRAGEPLPPQLQQHPNRNNVQQPPPRFNNNFNKSNPYNWTAPETKMADKGQRNKYKYIAPGFQQQQQQQQQQRSGDDDQDSKQEQQSHY